MASRIFPTSIGHPLTDKITYYAIIAEGRTVDKPFGLVRRLELDEGTADEGLRRDFGWEFTPVIVEWQAGTFEDELVEVDHEQAEKIMHYFRERWT
jgi:hypothetical protein